MALRKKVADQIQVTAILTPEEHELLEAFAAEQGINLEQAIPALLHEVVRLHDELWDMQFAKPHEAVDRLAREALDEYHAGLTIEDKDFDDDLS